jgi:RNA polymerase sigma factor (sigma-70 family)
MANAPLGLVLRHMCRFVGMRATHDVPDRLLLERFAAGHDEAAFEELVQRHGPMVYGVCRRVLNQVDDAEDAFQATFLMLAHKAAAIRQQQALAGWLYEVAHNMALKTKLDAARRRTYERRAAEMLQAELAPQSSWQDVSAVLDEELRRLPAKYRTPLVLCYLEGKTNEQAARELGWPAGSMSRHLARAKDLLRERIARRGVTVATGLLFALLAEKGTAAVPVALMKSTTKAASLLAAGNLTAAGLVSIRAVVLVKETMKAMFISKLKIAAVLTLAIGALSVGTTMLAYQADGPSALAAADQPAPAAEKAPAADAYGDPLPPDALMRLGTNRLRHSSVVTYVAFLPDGKSLLTASEDGAIRLWDLESGKEIRRFEMRAEGPKPDRADLAAETAEAADLQAEIKLLRAQRARAADREEKQAAKDNKDNKQDKDKEAEAKKAEEELKKRQAELEKLTQKLAQAARDRAMRSYAGNAAFAVAVSPDGKTLAFTAGNVIQLADVATGKHGEQIKPRAGVVGLVFAPDGKTLAVRGGDQATYLHAVDTGKEIRQIKMKPPQQAGDPQRQLEIALEALQGGGVARVASSVSVAYSPSGKELATIESEYANRKRIGWVKLWDPETGKETGQIQTPQPVSTLSYSPDGKFLAYASGATIFLSEPGTGKEIRQIKAPAGGAVALLFTPDSKLLAAKAGNQAIHLYDPETGNETRQVGEANARATPDLAVSPDGKIVASGGGSNAVRLWDVATGKELPAGGHRAGVSALQVSSDGKVMISMGADQTIRRWDTTTGKELSQLAVPEGTTCIAIAPDGKTLALGNRDNSIRVVDAVSGAERHKITGLTNGVAVVAFSADGKALAARGPAESTIRLFDPANGTAMKQLTMQLENKAADGNQAGWVIAGGGAATIHLGLAFAPDGRTIVSTGPSASGRDRLNRGGAMEARHALYFWDAANTREGRKILLPAQRGVLSYVFAPDGRLLATENSDGTISLWEVASGKERAVLGKPAAPQQANRGMDVVVKAQLIGRTYGGGGPVATQTLAFSPDGRLLASRSGNRVQVWDVAAAKEIKQFAGHQGPISTLAFAATGKMLASGSSDTTILLWDVSGLTASQPAKTELTAREVEELWASLAGDDAAKASASIQALAAVPANAVPFLEKNLKPVAAIDPKKIEQLIADLDNDKFAARKQAEEELAKLGKLARPALEKLLANQPALETKKRAEALLEKLSVGFLTGEGLREVRAIEVLEQVADARARAVLETIGKGAAGAVPTEDAQAALARLASRGK